MAKKERYRAIIFRDNKIALMERHKPGKDFFVFPGGGLEKGETPKQCCEREVLEEFGIKVRAKNMVYEFLQNGEKQGFFVCDWLEGEIHKTDAEEYTQKLQEIHGTFDPGLFDLELAKTLPIKPEELKDQLFADLEKFGQELNFKTKTLKVADM